MNSKLTVLIFFKFISSFNTLLLTVCVRVTRW